MKKKYVQLYEDIKKKISAKVYVEQLPSEAMLMEEYEVSRITVRRAIELLREDGIVVSKHGKGVMIVEQRPLDLVLSGTDNFLETGKKNSEKYKTTVETFEQVLVKEELAEQSYFPLNTVVTHINRIRIQGTESVILDINYFLHELTDKLTMEQAEKSVYEYIGTESDVEIQLAKREVTVEKATELDKKYLDLAGFDTVAVLHNHVYLSDGRLLEYSQLRHRPDVFEFSSVVRRKEF